MVPLDTLRRLLGRRILVLDGAMGTMVQAAGTTEADVRGERFADWPASLAGANDLLSLTRPDLIRGVHADYLAAGADVVTTNTFNAQAVSLADYELQDLAYELNVASARLAKAACEAASTPENPRFVAGSIGPMNRTLSLSPDVEDPGARAVTFGRGQGGLRRADPRARRRRRRPPARRDHLRHAQRQGVRGRPPRAPPPAGPRSRR